MATENAKLSFPTTEAGIIKSIDEAVKSRGKYTKLIQGLIHGLPYFCARFQSTDRLNNLIEQLEKIAPKDAAILRRIFEESIVFDNREDDSSIRLDSPRYDSTKDGFRFLAFGKRKDGALVYVVRKGYKHVENSTFPQDVAEAMPRDWLTYKSPKVTRPFDLMAEMAKLSKKVTDRQDKLLKDNPEAEIPVEWKILKIAFEYMERGYMIAPVPVQVEAEELIEQRKAEAAANTAQNDPVRKTPQGTGKVRKATRKPSATAKPDDAAVTA